MQQLKTQNVASPGSFGINSEDSGVFAPLRYAKTASNCIISRDNRLAARKALDPEPPTSAFSGAVKQIYEVINTDGVDEFIWTTPTKIYAGYPTYADITGSLTITAGDWQFCNLQNTVFAVQRSHAPAAWRKIAGTWTAQTITLTTLAGAKPDVALSAFGRVWLANDANNKYTIWFSEELNPLNFDSSGAGTLDISKAIIGNDNIVALASFGNRLVVLCEKQVITYLVNPDATPFLSIDEVIKGVGCLSRDSVVNTGSDLVWLAKQGVVSLGRLINSDGQLPIGDISNTVHTLLQSNLSVIADFTTVKGCWWEAEQCYLLLLPVVDTIYCFNLRVLNDAGPSVTIWDSTKSAACIVSDLDRNLHFGGINTWYLYRGYGSGADTYRMKYFSGYVDFGSPESFKFLKNISFRIRTGLSQSTLIKWAFDYSDIYEANTFTVTGLGGLDSEYGIAEYGIAEYSSGPQIFDLRSVCALSGQYLQFGIETDIQGNEYVIYNTELHVTTGKRY